MSSVKRIKVAHERCEDKSSTTNEKFSHIQDLPTDVFQHCLEFVGKGNFVFVTPVSKHFYWNYINLGVEMKNNIIDVDVILQQGRNRQTTIKAVMKGSLRLATECFLNAPKEFQLEVCRQAAVNGRLDILKCAAALGVDMKESVFPKHNADGTMSYDVPLQLAEIVANDHLDVIEFLHNQGVDLDNEDIIIAVGKSGKARNLHWMVSKGLIPVSFQAGEVVHCLLRNGEIDILKEHYANSFVEVDEDDYIFEACAAGGNIEAMNWLLEHHACEWSSDIFSEAAKSGSIPMLELCLRNGCPTDADVFFYAMTNKNKEEALDALKWLREHSIPWDEHVCTYAVDYGNFEALKWARDNGCPTWSWQTFRSALQNGNIEILDYCFQYNCPIESFNPDEDTIYDNCFDDYLFSTLSFSEKQERSLKLYKSLHQQSIPWDEGASLKAAQEGHLATLIWAVENGCPWHDDILEEAFRSYDIPLVEYCLQHLAPTEDDIYVLAMDKMNEANESEVDGDTDVQMTKVLQKIHDCGVPWSGGIISCTERHGRSNVAHWLRCMGCPE